MASGRELRGQKDGWRRHGDTCDPGTCSRRGRTVGGGTSGQGEAEASLGADPGDHSPYPAPDSSGQRLKMATLERLPDGLSYGQARLHQPRMA